MSANIAIYELGRSGLPGEAVAYFQGAYPGLITATGERISDWRLPHFDIGGFDESTGQRTLSGNLTDFVNNDVGWLIVSERIRKALERGGVGSHLVQWLDVCFHVNGKEIVEEYFVANLLDMRDAVHRLKSTYLGPNRTLTRFVLRRSALEGATLFRATDMPRRVFVSEGIKRLIDLANPTGVEWWKAAVAD